jgi:hypothetical protein
MWRAYISKLRKLFIYNAISYTLSARDRGCRFPVSILTLLVVGECRVQKEKKKKKKYRKMVGGKMEERRSCSSKFMKREYLPTARLFNSGGGGGGGGFGYPPRGWSLMETAAGIV